MYHGKTPRTLRRRFALAAAGLLLAAALAAAGAWGAGRLEKDLAAKGAGALRATVLERAVQCYALEGAYPPSLAYLEENYGLQVDRSRYIVTYEAFAPNLLPDVTVLQKGG
ncbi:hypothetical protein CE91St44_30830 [Oscillospiraceae bacterium]|uniref:hypothetical protein n=1 Tax=Allofournierella sp. TaxID=1940256 RepID=UPI0020845F8A|nr:hypothetical protein CE91St44_30830 [Oscillospiraceae bacterium]